MLAEETNCRTVVAVERTHVRLQVRLHLENRITVRFTESRPRPLKLQCICTHTHTHTQMAPQRGSSALFSLVFGTSVVPNFAPATKIVEANLVVGGPLSMSLLSRSARGLDG